MRRFLLAMVVAVGLGGCHRNASSTAPLRLGYLPNITHAQALVGANEGTFQRHLGAVPLTLVRFNAGPEAMEALVAGSLDACYVGPSPATIAYVRSHGMVRVIAGAASGGAVLVVRSATQPSDLRGKKLASPQVGNTQDVALRHWLKAQGVEATVLPIANADTLSLFQRGQIEGAWVPEPWGARLVREAGGRVLVDERDLWPGAQFPTTVLVASEAGLRRRRSELLSVVRAHLELTRRWTDAPAAFQTAANDAFQKVTGRRLSDPVLRDAFSRLSPTAELMLPRMLEQAARAVDLGYLPRANLDGLVDPSLLEEVQAPKS